MIKRLVGLLTVAVAGLLLSSIAIADTIDDSAHDFSANGYAGGEICIVCHTPHSAPGTDGPLWNRADYTASGFTMYPSGGTIDGTIDAQPTGTSVICLSCHDGSVAIDSFGGATGTTFVTGGALLDVDLTDDHPISITYVATAGTEMNAVGTAVTFGNGDPGDIQDLLDTGDKVQCTSCHDVHNTQSVVGEAGLLRIDNTGVRGSDLCLSCHAK